MPRRRSSAPSPLQLTPSHVPIRRGHAKFVVPRPPSQDQVLHLSPEVHQRLRRRGDSVSAVALKEMPRLNEMLAEALAKGALAMEDKEGSDTDESAASPASDGTASSTTSKMGLGLKPWSGKDALLPQIAIW